MSLEVTVDELFAEIGRLYMENKKREEYQGKLTALVGELYGGSLEQPAPCDVDCTYCVEPAEVEGAAV